MSATIVNNLKPSKVGVVFLILFRLKSFQEMIFGCFGQYVHPILFIFCRLVLFNNL